LGAGGVAMLVAALADRRTRKRAERERPGTTDPETTPEYVTEEQLVRNASRLRTQTTVLATEGMTPLSLRLVDLRFGQGASKTSSLAGVNVLVCNDPITSMRELLPIFTMASTATTPLIIAAPSVEQQTADTLVANHMAGKLTLQVLVPASGDATALAELAAIAQATPITFIDLRAGDVTAADLGFLELSVTTADPAQTFVSTSHN
jgi:chaperonin GroEL (HSP60 family)